MKDTVSQTGWSEARKIAWKGKVYRPNEFYYRFNNIGEENRNGPWELEERKKFMERLKTHGANFRWGQFSKPIYGRVGYMCSNEYRRLIKHGIIFDMNYRKSGTDLTFIRTKDERTKRFSWIVLEDDTGVFPETPFCHEKAPKIIKEKCKTVSILKQSHRLQKEKQKAVITT